MDLGLQGKVVVVTGGGAGIGGAISETLANEGAIPVIFARSAPSVEFLARLTALSPNSGWIQADLAKDDDCRRAVAQAQARWGQIYGLVNNAGTTKFVHVRHFDGLDAADFEARQVEQGAQQGRRWSRDRNLRALHMHQLQPLSDCPLPT